MMRSWHNCKKILCIRPDNMGDLLMSGPAISALKETFGCHITLLTSSMAKGIAAYIQAVDETLIWDVPWVKGTDPATDKGFHRLVHGLREKEFDAAVIFTVFSQNPLPTALMATLAGIPNRLAYCRENPYHLLSHWVPDEEPYRFLRHQVRRDIDLVASVGARTADEHLRLRLPVGYDRHVKAKLSQAGVNLLKPWIVIHPGASEKKREYPPAMWIEAGKKIARELGCQLIITGSQNEKAQAEAIRAGIGDPAHSLAGSLSLEELITLIRCSALLISVNTGTVHIAAAVKTKVIVLYALTNPQHAPWKSVGKILPFSVAESLQSRNEVLRFVHEKYFSRDNMVVTPDDISHAARYLLTGRDKPLIEELVLPGSSTVQGMRSTLNFHEP